MSRGPAQRRVDYQQPLLLLRNLYRCPKRAIARLRHLAAERQHRIPPQVSSSICMVQINLQHCRAAASVLCKQLSEYETVIALVQERKEKYLA